VWARGVLFSLCYPWLANGKGRFTKCSVPCNNARDGSRPGKCRRSCDTGAGNTGCSFQPWFYFQWSRDPKPPPLGLQVLFRKKGYWSSALDSRCSTTSTSCVWTLGQQPLEALGAWRDAAPQAPPRSTASGPAFHKTPR